MVEHLSMVMDSTGGGSGNFYLRISTFYVKQREGHMKFMGGGHKFQSKGFTPLGRTDLTWTGVKNRSECDLFSNHALITPVFFLHLQFSQILKIFENVCLITQMTLESVIENIFNKKAYQIIGTCKYSIGKFGSSPFLVWNYDREKVALSIVFHCTKVVCFSTWYFFSSGRKIA